MTDRPKLHEYKSIDKLVTRIRDDLRQRSFVLLFAYNGTGKTRLSMAFKDVAKLKGKRDTLYFNAFTEDLFVWDNDLVSDKNRYLNINSDSVFFEDFQSLNLEDRISSFLERYASFNFRIDYENWRVIFYRDKTENIKVSRGEQNIFIWCVFLAICQLVLDGHEGYKWVKHIYIDDPISSLDDNNAIAVASDLAELLKTDLNRVKAVVSTHHSLFFNVMWNELRKEKPKAYFYHRPQGVNLHTLRGTDETPFFNHIAMLSELQMAVNSDQLYTYHFNMMRTILEKTATFFGYKNFSDCFEKTGDEALFARAVNLLSHGKYSIYEPREMVGDNKDLFKNIFNAFLSRYSFVLPEIINHKEQAQ